MTDYLEEDWQPLSALQHLAFCPRQWGLIHIEQVWVENRLTMEGHYLHERVDEDTVEVRGNERIVRGLRIHSARLGLVGRADAVHFTRGSPDPTGVLLPGETGRWQVEPVEYKHGKPKADNCDAVQLCAQALCLEDMLDTRIASGSLFYGKTRRRQEIQFDLALRSETEALAAELHRLYEAQKTPPAVYADYCHRCSIYHYCKPETMGRGKSARRYLGTTLNKMLNEEDTT